MAKKMAMDVAGLVTKVTGFAISSSPDGENPYKILLIGETGSGKTSFLNFMCNAEIILRCGDDIIKAVEDFTPFNDVKLENSSARMMESKTTGAKVYRTKIMNLDVDVIDTPGFGDTSRGMDQDNKNAKSIVSTVSGEDYLNCICLIVNGRQSRISATLKYVLSEITAILPQHVVNNIVVVFTNVSEYWDLNFDVTVLDEHLGQPVPVDHVFCLENPYCLHEKAKKQQGVLTEKWINASLRRSLEGGSVMLKNLHEVISKLQPVHTDAFEQLFDSKQAIERNVMRLLQEYDNQKKLESEVRKVGEEVEAAAQNKHLHKDFELTRTVERWVQVETDQHNTLCGAKDCNSNCHVKCSVPRWKFKFMIWFCESIKNNECKKCGHSYKLHYHNKVINKKEVENVEVIDEETRKKFQNATNIEEERTIILDGLKSKLSTLIQTRTLLLEELNVTISQFEQLGLNRSYIKLLERQIELIEQRVEAENGSDCKDFKVLKQNIEAQIRTVREALTSSYLTIAIPF